MRLIIAAMTAFGILCSSVSADEILDTLNDAVAAYEDGEIQETQELLDYAATLLAQKRSGSLASVLPEALEGWTKQAMDDAQSTAALTMVGGGTMVGATYRNGSGQEVEFQIIAESPMIAMMAAQFGNTAILAQLGQVKRINRQKVVVTHEGDVQAMVDNRFMVQIQGDGAVEDKLAYFEALDLKAMKDF